MKPITEWTLSEKTWTLRDMLISETIKKGPQGPNFAHAIYNLIKRHVDDLDVSENDIQNLTYKELVIVSELIAQNIINNIKVKTAINRMSSMVDDVYKESKSS